MSSFSVRSSSAGERILKKFDFAQPGSPVPRSGNACLGQNSLTPLSLYISTFTPQDQRATSSKAYIKADIPCALRTAHAIT
jgi:hypothetical protein